MLEGSILQRLADAHHAERSPLQYGVYYKNTLIALCHALEDCILESKTSPLVIAAFQRGKWYLQEADRYAQLAERSRQIAIMAAPETGFAEHPTSQEENVQLVSLNPDDPVAQEWHLIIIAPSYTAMVLCQELSEEDYGPEGLPSEDRERKFYGFWTFEPALVREAAQLAISHIEPYNSQLHQSLSDCLQDITREASSSPQSDDLVRIVSRVVDYLQTTQHDIGEQLKASASPYSPELDRNLVSNELQAFIRIAQLIDLTDTGNPQATAEVAALAETLGQLLNLPAWQLKRLRLASLLHRLSPLQGTESTVASGLSSVESPEAAPSCPLTEGTQALRTLPRLRAVAQIIAHQNEWWNGQGQPAGWAGEDIPVESRILALAAYFQQRTNRESASTDSTEAMDRVLKECQAQQGDRWDPKIVAMLGLLVKGLQQGLSLPVEPPKVSSGMWLLERHFREAPASQGAMIDR